MLIILVIFIFAGGWLLFVRNKSQGRSNWILCLIMLVIPVLFHIVGLPYASYLHDEGQAFGSAYLSFLLLFNSLIMLVVNIIKSINNKKNNTNIIN
ncbi:biotin transporter BioY [Bacillus pakistanensis]|uniref:Biotin transporter BioY n=1 Tax=Rossellomorea pakistanensis TaxID=992288 RepID=A0ABS2N7Y1_9BACI|nr:hypothetical protein [Bacillus pakistanensis]MBM7583956.1 biotin transporter BioY [Bacillus pakistanensis]